MKTRDLGNTHTNKYGWRATFPYTTLNYTSIFTCWWGGLLVNILKSSLPTVRWHNATRKHIFLYTQGDRSGLRKPKKFEFSILTTATTSAHLPSQFQLIHRFIFSFNQPNKPCSCNKKSTHYVFLFQHNH